MHITYHGYRPIYHINTTITNIAQQLILLYIILVSRVPTSCTTGRGSFFPGAFGYKDSAMMVGDHVRGYFVECHQTIQKSALVG
jgi:hypothetical protein